MLNSQETYCSGHSYPAESWIIVLWDGPAFVMMDDCVGIWMIVWLARRDGKMSVWHNEQGTLLCLTLSSSHECCAGQAAVAAVPIMQNGEANRSLILFMGCMVDAAAIEKT